MASRSLPARNKTNWAQIAAVGRRARTAGVSIGARRREARSKCVPQCEVPMTGPDILDDTTDDYERFETELVAQDRDAVRVSTADIYERRARHLVGELIEDDVVRPIAEERVLVHEPSGEAFDSITQLAVFHRGWRAATDVDAEDN